MGFSQRCEESLDLRGDLPVSESVDTDGVPITGGRAHAASFAGDIGDLYLPPV